MRDEGGERSCQCLDIVCVRLLVAVKDVRFQLIDWANGPSRPQCDMALVDVRCEDCFSVERGELEIGEFERGTEAGDTDVVADPDGHLRFEDRLGPAGKRDRRARLDEVRLEQMSDERAINPEPLERGGSAEADFPAEGPIAGGEPLAAPLQLCRQASQGSSYPARSSEPAPRQPQRSTTSSSEVLLNPCQCPAGVKTTSPVSDGSSPTSV